MKLRELTDGAAEIFAKRVFERHGDGALSFIRVFWSRVSIDEFDQLPGSFPIGFPGCTLVAEKPRSRKNRDGTFEVTFRFTLLPEPQPDQPQIVATRSRAYEPERASR